MKHFINKQVSEKLNTYLILDWHHDQFPNDKNELRFNKQILRIGKNYGFGEYSRKGMQKANQIQVYATTSTNNEVIDLKYVTSANSSNQIQIISAVSKERILEAKKIANGFLKITMFMGVIFALVSAFIIKNLQPEYKETNLTDQKYFNSFLSWVILNSFFIIQITRYVIKQMKANTALFTLSAIKKVINAPKITEKSHLKGIK